MASTSRGIHEIALKKASKLQVTSLAGCRLTYLQFAGEFTRGVIADCLQLQVILCGIAVVFTCDSSVLPANCRYFRLQKQAILHASRGRICISSECKIPVKYPWCSGKFTCACGQFAFILRQVHAASTQVNLPVFTGKLHVTQINCVWGLFTCELQVKLPAFAGNFARASFTVQSLPFNKRTEQNSQRQQNFFRS